MVGRKELERLGYEAGVNWLRLRGDDWSSISTLSILVGKAELDSTGELSDRVGL